MSTTSEHHDAPWAREPPPAMRWRNWPLRDNVLAGLGVLAALSAAGLGVRWVTEQTHLAWLAVALLALALWRFFLPASFELNADGVSQWRFRRCRRISWNAVRRYEICSAGVLLLPHADRCPMDPLRGLYVPWGSRRDEVLAQIRYYLDRPPG